MDDHEDDFRSEAANDFYVDNGLMSVDTPQRAVSLIKQRKGLCARGGLRLHKFVSNSKDVISAIPPEDHSSPLKNLNLGHDRLPIERALGVQWCLETDTFQLRITVQDTPLTRRSILSTVSSVYDPLGFISPVLLVGNRSS